MKNSLLIKYLELLKKLSKKLSSVKKKQRRIAFLSTKILSKRKKNLKVIPKVNKKAVKKVKSKKKVLTGDSKLKKSFNSPANKTKIKFNKKMLSRVKITGKKGLKFNVNTSHASKPKFNVSKAVKVNPADIKSKVQLNERKGSQSKLNSVKGSKVKLNNQKGSKPKLNSVKGSKVKLNNQKMYFKMKAKKNIVQKTKEQLLAEKKALKLKQNEAKIKAFKEKLRNLILSKQREAYLKKNRLPYKNQEKKSVDKQLTVQKLSAASIKIEQSKKGYKKKQKKKFKSKTAVVLEGNQ